MALIFLNIRLVKDVFCFQFSLFIICFSRQNGADFSAGSPFSLPLPDFSDDDSVDSKHPKFMDIKREPSFEDPDQSTVSTYTHTGSSMAKFHKVDQISLMNFEIAYGIQNVPNIIAKVI